MRLTSLDKVLWPETGFTKGDLVDYYRRVAPALLPHVAGRPLTLGRFPGGVDGPGFAQTECRGRPEWMATMPLRLRSGELREFCVVNDLPSLLWVANQNAIELHVFIWRGERPDEAPAVLFDLDPEPGSGLLDCCRVALRLRESLDALGLASLAKTTGSTGLHVHVPLGAGHGFDATRAFARELADRLRPDHPGVAVDWRRNHPRMSAIAAYSLRAMDRPAAAAPVWWEEVEAALAAGEPEGLVLAPEAVVERVERLGDLLRPLLEPDQRLPPAA